jgi:ribosomal protein L17
MNKKLLILPFLLCSMLSAKTVESKEMKAKDYEKHYDRSSNVNSTEDKVISSTAEASAQITIMVTIQASSEIISRRNVGNATMSFLDNNRIQITEEIAKGEGEHLETLLSMLKLKKDKKSLAKIQTHFDELIYLNHSDFIDKLTTIV